ncbi:MAG TPA: hypothetical protein VF476_16745 [Chitinophagaceae bacterium]
MRNEYTPASAAARLAAQWNPERSAWCNEAASHSRMANYLSKRNIRLQ